MAWTTPRTWVNDEAITKAKLDQELYTNMLELETDAEWQPVTLGGGWGLWNPGAGWPPPRICRRAGQVFLQGMLSGGSTANGTAVATFPTEFAPYDDLHFLVGLTANWAFVNVLAVGVLQFDTNPNGAANSWMPVNLCWPVP